jgi:protein DGCR14
VVISYLYLVWCLFSLQEDDYCEALSHIIQRDFFPTLHNSDRAASILAALESDDPDFVDHVSSDLAASTVTRRDLGLTPGRTPYSSSYARYSETPTRSVSRQRAPENARPYDPDLTLTTFLSRYTSEDNASFAEILERTNEARKRRFSWAFDKEKESNNRAKRAREARERLVEMVRMAIEKGEDVKMIEGVEAGRPGERVVLTGGQETLAGDRQSIENAKRKMLTGPTADERLLIEGPGVQGEDGKKDKGKGKEVVLSGATEEDIDSTRKESKDSGLVQGWPFAVSLGDHLYVFAYLTCAFRPAILCTFRPTLMYL